MKKRSRSGAPMELAGAGTSTVATMSVAYTPTSNVASRRWPSSSATMGANPAHSPAALPSTGPPRLHMRAKGRLMYGANWLAANHE